MLIGSRGLLPVAPLVRSIAAADPSGWTSFPSLLWLDPSDTALRAGVVLGALLSALAAGKVWPRACFALSAPLYLSYVVAGRDFLSFQWDNLLVESLVLAAFLPRDRPSPIAHQVMRLLLFKLYFESGIAKAQSHLGDWIDGSAMHYYYETAPLPAWPAWWAHHLPGAWHSLESWGALGLETVGALLILGPRPARLLALAGFTGFQLLNLSTANYGFFVYLALSLHLFLLDDRDLANLRRRLPFLPSLRDWHWLPRLRLPPPLRPAAHGVGIALAALWAAASLATAWVHFGPDGALRDAAFGWMQGYRVFRVANAYHLFGYITRERIEPEIQTTDGGEWQAHDLRYKPGDPLRAPPFVAPHQPRVDFQLWFHGLGFRGGTPEYVRTLLRRLCTDPAAVQSLFPKPLDPKPRAVRVEYWRYHFTTPEERRETGAWWRREPVAATVAIECAPLRRNGPGP